MPTYLTPGVYIEETPQGVPKINDVSTSETAFVDFFASGPLDEATRVVSFAEFEEIFGGLDMRSEASYAIQQYFANGGSIAWVVRVASAHEPPSSEWIESEGARAILGWDGERKGLYALRGSGFNILCLPGAASLSTITLKNVYDAATTFCNDERAFLIVDVPVEIDTPTKVAEWLDTSKNPHAITRDKNAAVYFPRLTIADRLNPNERRNIGSSGTLAGVYARTDAQRGVWKAPAGTEASLRGVNLVTMLNDRENGVLNRLGVNGLRNFPDHGPVAWGARTLEGDDHQQSQWKYIPVRRTALFIERSLYEGSAWAVFEPNDELLWARIRQSFANFMQSLFRQGALTGTKPAEAYFIKCDETTTTQDDIDNGRLNVIIGFAQLRPAEFVIIRIQQLARKP